MIARHSVVVDEGDDLAVGSQQPDVARLAEVGTWAVEHADTISVGRKHGKRCILRRANHDNHLEVRVGLMLSAASKVASEAARSTVLTMTDTGSGKPGSGEAGKELAILIFCEQSKHVCLCSAEAWVMQRVGCRRSAVLRQSKPTGDTLGKRARVRLHERDGTLHTGLGQVSKPDLQLTLVGQHGLFVQILAAALQCGVQPTQDVTGGEQASHDMIKPGLGEEGSVLGRKEGSNSPPLKCLATKR